MQYKLALELFPDETVRLYEDMTTRSIGNLQSSDANQLTYRYFAKN